MRSVSEERSVSIFRETVFGSSGYLSVWGKKICLLYMKDSNILANKSYRKGKLLVLGILWSNACVILNRFLLYFLILLLTYERLSKSWR